MMIVGAARVNCDSYVIYMILFFFLFSDVLNFLILLFLCNYCNFEEIMLSTNKLNYKLM